MILFLLSGLSFVLKYSAHSSSPAKYRMYDPVSGAWKKKNIKWLNLLKT